MQSRCIYSVAMWQSFHGSKNEREQDLFEEKGIPSGKNSTCDGHFTRGSG